MQVSPSPAEENVSDTWMEVAQLFLTVAGIGVLGLLARILFEVWLVLRQIRSEWMPRIRDLLATTDETMASVEGVTRVAREQVEGWSPLFTDARHAAEGVRDQATLATHQFERTARQIEATVVSPLSREFAVWRHGLSALGRYLLASSDEKSHEKRSPSPDGGGDTRSHAR